MDNVQETPRSTEATNPTSVGVALHTAREALGLSVTDVAERIKFSVKQVEALEADNLSILPQGTFLRGFVRSYARTLNIDEALLLAMMTPPNEVHGDASEVQAGGLEFMPVKDANRKNLYLMASAFLIAVGLGLFIWSQQNAPIVEKTVLQEVALPEMGVASAVVSASSGVSEVSAVIAEVKLEQELPPPKVVEPSKVIAAPAKVVVAPKVIPPVASVVADKPKVVAPSVAVVTPLPVVEKPSIPLEQLKKRPIHIVFTQDSWMEIKDNNGELLLSRMNAAGTEKWIGGNRRAPYQVAIGKAEAVNIFYKGREVDLSKYSQTGVVRLVLE